MDVAGACKRSRTIPLIGIAHARAPDKREKIMSSTSPQTFHGKCFCGAVALTVTGQPAAMGYCHCESCRSWSAGPVNAFTLLGSGGR